MTLCVAMVVLESIKLSDLDNVTLGAIEAVAATLDGCANGDVLTVPCTSSLEGILASNNDTDSSNGVVSTRRTKGATGVDGSR